MPHTQRPGHRTARYELIQIRLGRDLAQYVAGRRASGDSWRRIAPDLSAVTGVTVSYETLRSWFERPVTEVAA